MLQIQVVQHCYHGNGQVHFIGELVSPIKSRQIAHAETDQEPNLIGPLFSHLGALSFCRL